MKKRVLLGTTNQAKTNIIREAVQSLPLDILSLSDLNIDIEVTEDGDSPEENAEKKARSSANFGTKVLLNILSLSVKGI